jgi:group I intron endonuclease
MLLNIPNSLGPCIYCIRNLDNEKLYIGQSKQVRIRIQKHIGDLEKNNHSSNEMQSDFNKGHKFTVDILYKAPKNIDTNILTRLESWYILNKKSYTDGYNSTLGPGSLSNANAKKYCISPHQLEVFKTSKRTNLSMPGNIKDIESFALNSIMDMLKRIDWSVEDFYTYCSLHITHS